MKYIILILVILFNSAIYSQLPCTEQSCDPAIALDPGYSPNTVEIGQTSEMTLDWEMLVNDPNVGCTGTPAGSWQIQISFPNTYTYNNDVITDDFSSEYQAVPPRLTLTNEDILFGATGTITYTVTANVNTNGVEDLTNINVFIRPIFFPGTCPAAFGNVLANDVVNDGIIITEPLDIELISFMATKKGERALLQWQTATEINNDYFEIERSEDGKEFEVLSERISGAGTSHEKQSYTWVDTQPMTGINYYRLKQVDFDAGYTYSRVRSLYFEGNDVSLSVYPNPARNEVTLSTGQKKGEVTLLVYDPNGKLVSNQSYEPGDWKTSTRLDLENMVEGMYMIVLKEGNYSETARFVKVR
jgi:hypothetical protein